MIYITNYNSTIGNLLLASNKESLIGLWIENQKYYLSNLTEEINKAKKGENIEILKKTKTWLDSYFQGKKVSPQELKLEPKGSDFQKTVWKLLCDIPYGEVTTYKEIAKKIAKIKNIKSMSQQAVGGAVSHNPISIIIPCHRVIGTNNSLTGYAGGIENKIKLLKIEKIDTSKFSIPKK